MPVTSISAKKTNPSLSGRRIFSMEQNQLHQSEPNSPFEFAAEFQDLPSTTAEEVVAVALPQEQEESVEALGTALSQEAQRFRRSVTRVIGGLSLFGALMIAVKLVCDTETWNAFIPAQCILSGTVSFGLIGSLFAVNSARKPRHRRRTLALRVADQYDVRSIGPLIDALNLDDAQTREIAAVALTDRLPHLGEDDDARLTESQRTRLCHLLSLPVESPLHKDIRALFRPADSRAIDFRVAILRALEKVGDSKAIPIVRQLATRKPGTPGERRIREAAITCLSALELRAEQLRSRRTLLRASHPNAAAPDTLLRPAVEIADDHV